MAAVPHKVQKQERVNIECKNKRSNEYRDILYCGFKKITGMNIFYMYFNEVNYVTAIFAFQEELCLPCVKVMSK